jgi:prepilin signal peptidase PulO-like enzyme (type II secretory pathway)
MTKEYVTVFLEHAIWVCAIMGAMWGSYFHVVWSRTPQMWKTWMANKSMNIWWSEPGSSCPKCHHALSWFENVPVLGWLGLRGKCRHCQAPIPLRYLLWEISWATAGGVGGFVAPVEFVISGLSLLVATMAMEVCWRMASKSNLKDDQSQGEKDE